MDGNKTTASQSRPRLPEGKQPQWGHVREHVLAGAALQLLNGEALTLNAASRAHLGRCTRCATRLDDLRGVLAGERLDATEAADAAFPEPLLRTQRASILSRLERARAGARVLSFPTPRSWMVRRDRPAMRWLAGAAAAGLLVGLGAGQLIFTAAPQHRFQSTSIARDWTPASWLGTSAGRAEPRIERLSAVAEEDFLSEMEYALNHRRVAALRALDDLTPRGHETPRPRK